MRRLTDDMRRDWAKKGYLHLKGALTRDQAESYLAAADEVIAKYRQANPRSAIRPPSTSSRRLSGHRASIP